MTSSANFLVRFFSSSLMAFQFHIRHLQVGAEVGMEVAAEGVGVVGAEVSLDAAQGEVHHREAAVLGLPKFSHLVAGASPSE